ncbi:hypothetical protein VTJ04DRAFT_3963 [Mycothermus thermophilus]|uniref:uncharacterized protein n=1 Tax=Humicola insolens TaxID=85995 RepID=UPI0037440F25
MLLSTTLILAAAGIASATGKACRPRSSFSTVIVTEEPSSTFSTSVQTEEPSSVFSTSVVTEEPSSTESSWSGRITSYSSGWPESCTFRPTQTYYSSSGCAITCDAGFCIRDEPATISCGCPTVFIETQYTTVCPTTSPCYQCHSAWGTFLYTEPCSTTTPTAAPAVPTD